MSFRPLNPSELWSAKVQTALPPSEFTQVLTEVSQETTFAFFGFVLLRELGTRYVFTRYPRRKYGIPSIESCEAALLALQTQLQQLDPKVHVQREHQNALGTQYIRIVLGLREGYGEKSLVHTVESVQAQLPQKVQSHAAQILSVRPSGAYTEPAIALAGTHQTLLSIILLAETLKQERFTVEDFSQKLAYVIETSLVTEPDTE